MTNDSTAVKYRTRIKDHIRLASAERMRAGGDSVSMKEVSRAIKIPYQTLRWYANTSIANPNYAVIEPIRSYLNQFHEMSLDGYVYRESEEESGRVAALAAS